MIKEGILMGFYDLSVTAIPLFQYLKEQKDFSTALCLRKKDRCRI